MPYVTNLAPGSDDSPTSSSSRLLRLLLLHQPSRRALEDGKVGSFAAITPARSPQGRGRDRKNEPTFFSFMSADFEALEVLVFVLSQ